MLAELATTADELTVVGGEPSLHPEFVEVVAAARAAGFEKVGIQTNGSALATRGLIPALVEAGLTDAHLSLHGASAAVHDYHTGAAGSFERVQSAARELGRHGVPWVVTTVITRSNFRGLAELVGLLVSLRASGWMMEWPRIAGRAADAFDRVHPRYGLAVPFALHAAKLASTAGLPVALAGIPSCTMGPFARLRVHTQPRGFGAVCEECNARDDCAGVDPYYVLRFGEVELHALDARIGSAPSGIDASLVRMFVGVGLSAERAPPTRTPSPVAARRALPVLGRPQPGRDEVRQKAHADPQVLRNLFPTLYDDGQGPGEDPGEDPG